MSGNYPPGMSKRDFVRAGIDQPHHHEHEFFTRETDPIFEDCAAIFSEECEYVEGEYGDGFSCEETRYVRCDLHSITVRREGLPNIEWLAFPGENREGWSYPDHLFEEALIRLESNTDESTKILDLDPPGRGDGFVRVSVGKYILEYQE